MIWPVTGFAVRGYPDKSLPMSLERRIERFIAVVWGCHRWKNHEIQRLVRLLPNHPSPEAFPYHALDSVTADGLRAGLLRYGHPKSMPLHPIGASKNSEKVIARPEGFLEYRFEFCRLEQS